MNDELKHSFQQIVKDCGPDIINDKNLANIVADYYSFDRNPAVRNILKTVVSEGYAVKIGLLRSSKGDPKIELERYAYEIKQSWGYGADEIRYVISCIANSVGIPLTVNNPWDKESSISEPHQNQSPIANQNNNPQINQVPNNIDKSSQKQKWGRYFVIGIVIFSLLGFGAYQFLTIDDKNQKTEYQDASDESKENILQEEEESIASFITQHIRFKQSESDAETSIDIDYPIEGNKNLVDAIRKFILETLVDVYTWGDEMPKYAGDVSNGQAVVDFYGKTKMNMLKEESKREFNSERQLEESISINILKETERFVTYEVSFGGCHGGVYDGTSKGITFMKKDGKQLILFKNENDEELKQLVIKYVKDYFGSEADCLYESFYEKPMPQEPPTLSFNGITFIYQKYEIAPGSMSSTSITIPFDEISKFLSEDAKEVSGIHTSQTKEK